MSRCGELMVDFQRNTGATIERKPRAALGQWPSSGSALNPNSSVFVQGCCATRTGVVASRRTGVVRELALRYTTISNIVGMAIGHSRGPSLGDRDDVEERPSTPPASRASAARCRRALFYLHAVSFGRWNDLPPASTLVPGEIAHDLPSGACRVLVGACRF